MWMYSNVDPGADSDLGVHLKFAVSSSTRGIWQLSDGTLNVKPKCVNPPNSEEKKINLLRWFWKIIKSTKSLPSRECPVQFWWVSKQILFQNECLFWVSNYTNNPLQGRPKKELKSLPKEQSCFSPGHAFCKVSTALCLQITFISVV